MTQSNQLTLPGLESASALPDVEGVEYEAEWIINNPIPAICKKCGQRWEDGPHAKSNGAIRAPSLDNCRCFYCGGRLRPLDPMSYAERLRELPFHVHVRTVVSSAKSAVHAEEAIS